MRIPFLILILFSSTALHSQDFDELIEKAEDAYQNKMYVESGEFYDEAFCKMR